MSTHPNTSPARTREALRHNTCSPHEQTHLLFMSMEWQFLSIRPRRVDTDFNETLGNPDLCPAKGKPSQNLNKKRCIIYIFRPIKSNLYMKCSLKDVFGTKPAYLHWKIHSLFLSLGINIWFMFLGRRRVEVGDGTYSLCCCRVHLKVTLEVILRV